MDLLFVIAAAIVAWVAGALWYRLLAGQATRVSGVQADNRGDPRASSAAPYLIHGGYLLIVATTMRVLFQRAGIDGAVNGLLVGLTLGTLIVTPIIMMNDPHQRHPMVLTLIDSGHAILICAILGTILAAL